LELAEPAINQYLHQDQMVVMVVILFLVQLPRLEVAVDLVVQLVTVNQVDLVAEV
jgi:hypothetical protein